MSQPSNYRLILISMSRTCQPKPAIIQSKLRNANIWGASSLQNISHEILIKIVFKWTILSPCLYGGLWPGGFFPLFLAKPSPHKSVNCPSPLFKQPSLYIVFCEPSLKVGFFSEPPKHQSFLSLTPSFVLKVTKFLVEISQFEFSVMTEKNIFAHKLFMPFNKFDWMFITVKLIFFLKLGTSLRYVIFTFITFN